jgi:type I restriction enzyme M protein
VTANASANVAAIIVAQGRVLDFIDGHTQRRETPEEYVRQEIAKSLVREYGYRKPDIEVEFCIRIGTRKPRADLVVFSPDAPHTQEHARLIVECKAPTVKAADKDDGTDQLKSYLHACPNAIYGLWTNGVGGERYCYRRIVKGGNVLIEPVLDIPEAGRDVAEEDRPRFDQLKPAESDALLFAFKRCHNFIAGNQGLPKPQAFWELLKLIFCKIRDEKHSDEVQFYAGPTEVHGMNGPPKVVKRIEKLFAEVKAEFPTIFRDNETIELKPTVLAFIVSQLQKYSLLDSDIDVKGRAYEEIVGSNLRGDRGEFFTPRNVCKMAVAMLDPDEDQLILDPACGTGGFLITSMNHVIARVHHAAQATGGSSARVQQAAESRINSFLEKRIVGIDFNPELVKASKMNMVMNNDGEGGLYQANSLERPVTWDEELRKRKLIGRVDLLFTNPPFGSKIPVSDPSKLEQFELGHAWTYDKALDRWNRTETLQRSQPPELLFIERCVQFLKPGTGRAAIVLPDGVLGSPGLGYVRQWLLDNTRILASIDMHPDTFQPFVSVQTSLLVLQRKSDEQMTVERASGSINDYEVFMAVADHIGHDKRGNITYLRDAAGNEIVQAVPKKSDEREGKTVIMQDELRKVVDDNTYKIAREFRRWLSEQE